MPGLRIGSTGPAQSRRAAPLLLAAVVLLAGLAAPAYGYTDPGSGLMLWQILGAAVMGTIFSARRLLSRFRLGRRGRQDEGVK